jgi:hypothetical protein
MTQITTHIWEISEDGKIAIIQSDGQFHVLVAEDTVNTFSEAVSLAEDKRKKFERIEEIANR